MTNPDPAQLARDSDELRALHADSVLLLRAVRETLAELLDRVMRGEDGNVKDMLSKQAELETALKRAFEAEMKYNERIEKQRGNGVRDGEIDFDQLRHEIGCRLSRLRACCAAD